MPELSSEPIAHSTPTRTRDDAQRTARDLLTTTWAPDLAAGDCPLPVDPVFVAERLGVKVIRVALEANVSGMLAKRTGQDAEICINACDSSNRRRFSCAYELGHYVRRESGDPRESWAHIEERGPTAPRRADPATAFADQFAAELLMPEPIVRRLARELSPAAMAAEFDVPLGTMKIRLERLGLE